jgi:hypothetical protein
MDPMVTNNCLNVITTKTFTLDMSPRKTTLFNPFFSKEHAYMIHLQDQQQTIHLTMQNVRPVVDH